ncbi:MAG: hypothetical protein AAF490_29890 [Chloroflexota bacterium]
MINSIKKAILCDLQNNRIMLAHSLVWAAVILAVSWILRESDQSEAVFLILITASSSSFLLVQNKTGKKSNYI